MGEGRRPGDVALDMSDSIGPPRVTRALNETRLAVLGILVSIGLTVAFGVGGPWWVELLAGLGSFAVSCGLIRWRTSRNFLMKFMHFVTEA